MTPEHPPGAPPRDIRSPVANGADGDVSRARSTLERDTSAGPSGRQSVRLAEFNATVHFDRSVEANGEAGLDPVDRRPDAPEVGPPCRPSDGEPGPPNHADAPGRETAKTIGSPIDLPALYRLMAWLSPAYPIGAFSYSSGLEWAVEAGDVVDGETLGRWLTTVIAEGGGFCDAVFLKAAYGAVALADDQLLVSVAELAAAFAPSKERHLETVNQGGAFVTITQAAWPCAALAKLVALWPGPYALPVAVGVAAAGHQIAIDAALHAYLHALASNLVLAGLRLIRLGQTDGQRLLAGLEGIITETVMRAHSCALEDVGSGAFRADMASQHHETQYTRLFRS